jgi:hypothetical protein
MSRASIRLNTLLAEKAGSRARVLTAMAEVVRKVLEGRGADDDRPSYRDRDENKLLERQTDHENTTDVTRGLRAVGCASAPMPAGDRSA